MKKNEKKILFITFNNVYSLKSGGEYISYRNYLILNKICKTDLLIFNDDIKREKDNFLIPKSKNKMETFYYLLLGRFSYHKRYEEDIIKIIEKNKYDVVFLDSSLFGFLCQKIKKDFPKIEIITFFHNIEYNFLKERAKIESKLYYLMSFIGYLNEKKSIKNSDKLIVLNDRENRELNRIYKAKTKYIFPLTFEDKFNEKLVDKSSNINYLFLGSNFYANYTGIKWFVLNVMPNLKGTLYIVGKDFEKNKKELEILPNVKVIGTVDNTEEWYYKSQIIVSPIFSGSGMKTKTVEALMYGKYIFGTTEAFEGYELDFDKIGGLCNNADDFIKKIKEKEENIIKKEFNEYARKQFLEKYSWNSTKKQFMEIIIEN